MAAVTDLDPELKPVPEESGLFCWKDATRPCGADCMAYADPPQGADYENKQWAYCQLLVNSHKTAKHLAIVARVLSADQADRQRANQPPPPAVR